MSNTSDKNGEGFVSSIVPENNIEFDKASFCESFSKTIELPEELLKEFVPDTLDLTLYKYIHNEPSNIRELDKSLVFVHLTDYYPADGFIYSTHDALQNEDLMSRKESYYAYRLTVHGSLSYPVVSHHWGDWANCSYAVLIPFEDARANIKGFVQQDTYSVGPVELGNKSLVVSLDPTIESQNTKLYDKTSLQTELIEHGIIDISTLNEILSSVKPDFSEGVKNTSKIIELVVNDDWTVNLDKLKEFLDSNSNFKEILSRIDKLQVSRTIESPIHYAAIKGIFSMGKIPMVQKRLGKFGDEFRDVESPWTDSGAIKFLEHYYSENNPYVRGYEIEGVVLPHNHWDTVWGDIENVWKVCTNKLDSSYAMNSGPVAELLKLEPKMRLKMAQELIKPGGELWTNAVLNSWKSPKLFLYTYRVLHGLNNDLEDLMNNDS